MFFSRIIRSSSSSSINKFSIKNGFKNEITPKRLIFNNRKLLLFSKVKVESRLFRNYCSIPKIVIEKEPESLETTEEEINEQPILEANNFEKTELDLETTKKIKSKKTIKKT